MVGFKAILVKLQATQVAASCSHRLQWEWGAADLIHGYNKELFEDLNPTETLSVVKAQSGDKRDDSPITVSEVTKVVKKDPGVDEIPWEIG